MSHDLLHNLLHQYGDAFVFLLLMLEAMGLPLPGETVMVGAALYAARSHNLSLLPLVVAAASGAVLGGIIGYTLGRTFGQKLLIRYGPRIGLNADRRLLGHYLIQRNGPAMLFFGRYVPGLRSVAGLLAGAGGMGRRRFLLFNLLGGVVWTSLYCIGTYTLGTALTRLAAPAAVVLGIAAVVTLVAGFVFVRRHEARLIALAKRAQAAEELSA